MSQATCQIKKNCTSDAAYVVYDNNRPAYSCKRHKGKLEIVRTLRVPGIDSGK